MHFKTSISPFRKAKWDLFNISLFAQIILLRKWLQKKLISHLFPNVLELTIENRQSENLNMSHEVLPRPNEISLMSHNWDDFSVGEGHFTSTEMTQHCNIFPFF